MRACWSIARVTLKEGIRNRALYGIVLIALLLLAANQVISGMMMREIGKVAVDMAISTVSFAGLLLVLFIGINLLAKDLDKRTIYVVLSRPVSRSQYIVGKFIGMVLLLLVAVSLLSCFALLSIWLVKLSYPDYFARFSWGLVLLALVYAFVGLVMLTALSFLFSALTSTSFITFVLTVICYLIGHSLADVRALVETPDAVGIQVATSTIVIVKAAYYLLPNLSFFDIKAQAAHGLTLSLSHVLFTLGYGVVYSLLALILASVLFQRREFP